jgi:hypothetical protein
MIEYRRHVSGFFVKRDEAQLAFSKLAERGIPADQLKIYNSQPEPREPASDTKSNNLLKNMIVDGAVGAAVGTGIGAVVGSESTDKKDGKFAALVQDAITNGQVVLVAQTHSEQETATAEDVLKEAVGPLDASRTV